MPSYTITIKIPAGSQYIDFSLPNTLNITTETIKSVFINYTNNVAEVGKYVYIQCNLIGQNNMTGTPNYIATFRADKPEYAAIQHCDFEIITKNCSNIQLYLRDASAQFTTLLNDVFVTMNIFI